MIATEHVIEFTYLIATALFILSLKWLSSPATARRGVWAGEIGMFLAIVGTLLHRGIVDYKWIAIGLVLGTVIGVPLGKVAMTAVPQRTALSHAFGALCVTLVGTTEFYLRAPDVSPFMMSVLSLEVILGALTFTGSLMAAGKLQELLPQRPITYKGQNIVNLGLLAVAVGIAVTLVLHPDRTHLFPVMILIPAAVRRNDDYSDRRRGHADGDFAAKFLRGAFGGGDGVRAGKQTVDHCRRAGWRIWLDSFRKHVEGDESFVYQRAVWRVRTGAGGRGRRKGSAAGAQRFAGGSGRYSGRGQQSGDCSGLRNGGGAGAA